MELPKKPKFDPIKPQEVLDAAEIQFRYVAVPPHRRTPLEKAWKSQIYEPIRNEMKIDIRMNLKAKQVELKTMAHTPDITNLDKCASFVKAFMLGFDADEIRDVFFKYDNFHTSQIDMEDVKRTIKGEHLSRTIGRICGKSGKTKLRMLLKLESLLLEKVFVLWDHVMVSKLRGIVFAGLFSAHLLRRYGQGFKLLKHEHQNGSD